MLIDRCSSPCPRGQICSIDTCTKVGKLGIASAWSRPGDGDIVVGTPNGKYIYYGNVGPSTRTDGGVLDRDDLTGKVPENIY